MKTGRLIIGFFGVWLVLAVSGTALAAIHGTYLPDTTFPLGNPPTIDVTAYGSANGTEFTQDVICQGHGKVGYISFTYDTWTGNTLPAPGTATGGGALAGGFFKTADCQLAPGWQLGWVQIVSSTFSGSNVWGAANGTWFPDTGNSKTDPDYPYQSLPVVANPAPTVAFQDFPNRYPSDGDQYWLAELGLVCKNLTTHEMDIIDTFLWGFNISNGTFTANSPHLWSAPTANYITTLETYFDGTHDNADWTIGTDCSHCCIPEPTAIVVWSLLGGLAVIAGRRRRRKIA